jgi:hypothetical protein
MLLRREDQVDLSPYNSDLELKTAQKDLKKRAKPMIKS